MGKQQPACGADIHPLLCLLDRLDEDSLVFLDVVLQHAPFVLPALRHKLQVCLQLSPQVWLGHLITHGVVT